LPQVLPRVEKRVRTVAESKARKKKRNSGTLDDAPAAAPAAAPNAAPAAAAAAAPAAPAALAAPPSYVRRVLLPANAEQLHAAALAAAADSAYPAVWQQLRAAQAEDAQRLLPRMRWLRTKEHINRTSFAALKVNNALAVLCNETADQLSLRRHGGWT